MRHDSETNIIVLNTALKYYKIPRNTHKKKHKYIKYTKYKHILKEPVQKPERSVAPRERLKAFTEEKNSNITWTNYSKR